MVRSNFIGNLGFLVEKRRLNVAVTRAKRQLVLIGDSSTVSKDPFLKDFIDYIRDNGDVEAAPILDTKSLIIPFRSGAKTDLVIKGFKFDRRNLPSLKNYVSIDCEMVGVGKNGIISALGSCCETQQKTRNQIHSSLLS